MLASPPREIRPVSLLTDSASQLFGTISVNCYTTFEYDKTKGFRSKVSFPVPLVVQEEREGITHIESAQFSRRDNDEIDYRILVLDPEDSASFLHSIDFETTLAIDHNSIRGLLSRARAISTRLVVREGGD